MKRTLGASALLVTALWGGMAAASPRCTAPMADWQPRDALVERLRVRGWQVTRIRTDDGCYKVHAVTADGRRVKAKFDPATLEMLREEADR
ncbi:PepSY domain-containing protein [Phreatobacter aquaticus]|uniref:PepSY domain-containing protein n=1 Tax=Phreatobacter aquaticus TaxID=2570229 RepID=A0A4D7QPN0_9HYPH|nr:PepSY domain-containing protein [Phreatobacter aquaticus]QCK87214.1 PepSY domain-containing protein [Phreatobacter aquaticus]